MKNYDKQLTAHVMARVHTIFYMRTVVRPMLMRLSFLLLCGAVVVSTVSTSSIVHNIFASQNNLLRYVWYAFMRTEIIVQVGVALSALFILLLARDLYRFTVLYSKGGVAGEMVY